MKEHATEREKLMETIDTLKRENDMMKTDGDMDLKKWRSRIEGVEKAGVSAALSGVPGALRDM
jgi:hypothetical protein